MGRPKTYIIRLSEEERATLRKIIRNKKTCKTVLKRCQILLELDEEQGRGLTHTQLAHSYAVCPGTITNIVKSYVKNGITEIIRYNISPNSSAALRKVDGRAESWTTSTPMRFPPCTRHFLPRKLAESPKTGNPLHAEAWQLAGHR